MKGGVQVCQDVCPDQHYYTGYCIEPASYTLPLQTVPDPLDFEPDFNTGLVHEGWRSPYGWNDNNLCVSCGTYIFIENVLKCTNDP